MQDRYNGYKAAAHKRIRDEFPHTLNKARQDKHIAETGAYDPARSTLTADPGELIKLYAGNGDPILTQDGVWNQRERFTHTSAIGIYRDLSGTEIETKVGILHYAKIKGVHIVPANPMQR
jgi:hypothetical protein